MTNINWDKRHKEVRAKNVRIYNASDPAIYVTLDVASDGAMTITSVGGTDSDVIIDTSSGSGDLVVSGGRIVSSYAGTVGVLVSGANTNGLLISGIATTGIDITSVCTGSGFTGSALFQHGSYTNGIAHGTITADHLVLSSIHVTAATTAKYIMGDVCRIDTSADSTGWIMGQYGYLSVGHDLVNGHAVKGRVAITETCQVGEMAGILGLIEVTASKTITQTGAPPLTAAILEANIGASAAVEQEVMCLEIRPLIASNISGSSAGIRVNVNCSSANYLDYGIDIRSMSNNQTAAIRILATPDTNALATGIHIEGQDSTTSTVTNAIRLQGTVTNCLYFAEADGSQGAHSSDSITTQSGASTGSIRVSIAGTAYYIPIFAAGSQGAGW